MASRMNAWTARFADEVERGRAVLGGGPGEGGVGRAGHPGRGLPDEQDRVAGPVKAGPTSRSMSSSSPTTPISGVGAMAPSGDSL